MIKKTKHGRVSNGSGWGRSCCDKCENNTNGKEVILIYHPNEGHVERYDVVCFLENSSHIRDRYEIVMATMAINGVPKPFQGNGCNLCGHLTIGVDVIVSYVQGKGDNSRKFFCCLSCFMGEDEVRSTPNVHISTR